MDALRFAVAFFLTCSPFVLAQGGGRRALVIGNSAYSEKANHRDPFPSLKGAPVTDANAIEEALLAAGVPKDNITVLFDLRHDEFLRAIYGFRASLTDRDAAVFYFSGHGFSIDGQDYLVPIGFRFGGTKARAATDSISLRQVLDIMSKAPSRVVILDACRTAAPLLKSAGPVAASESIRPMVLMQGTGSLVGYSTSNETASRADSPGNGLSFFTYYLVKAFDARPKNILDALTEAQMLTSRASNNAQVPAIYDEMPYSTENGQYELYPQNDTVTNLTSPQVPAGIPEQTSISPNNVQLAETAKTLADQRRTLQKELDWHDANERETHRNPSMGPIPESYYSFQLSRIQPLRRQAIELRKAILSRLPPQPENMSVDEVLIDNQLAGVHPLYDVADYFDELARLIVLK